MSLPLPEITSQLGTLVNLGLYPFVIWLILEVRDQAKKQDNIDKTITIVVKTLLKKKIIESEEISGIRLG